MSTEITAWLVLAGLAAGIVLQFRVLTRGGIKGDSLERALRAEIGESSRAARAEMGDGLVRLQQTMGAQLTDVAKLQNDQIDRFGRQLVKLTDFNEQHMKELREAVLPRAALLATALVVVAVSLAIACIPRPRPSGRPWASPLPGTRPKPCPSARTSSRRRPSSMPSACPQPRDAW